MDGVAKALVSDLLGAPPKRKRAAPARHAEFEEFIEEDEPRKPERPRKAPKPDAAATLPVASLVVTVVPPQPQDADLKPEERALLVRYRQLRELVAASKQRPAPRDEAQRDAVVSANDASVSEALARLQEASAEAGEASETKRPTARRAPKPEAAAPSRAPKKEPAAAAPPARKAGGGESSVASMFSAAASEALGEFGAS